MEVHFYDSVNKVSHIHLLDEGLHLVLSSYKSNHLKNLSFACYRCTWVGTGMVSPRILDWLWKMSLLLNFHVYT